MTRGRSCGFTSENGKKGGTGNNAGVVGWLWGKAGILRLYGVFSPDFHYPHSHGYQDFFLPAWSAGICGNTRWGNGVWLLSGDRLIHQNGFPGETVHLKGIDGCGGKYSESPPRLMVCFIRKSKKGCRCPFPCLKFSSLPVPGTKDEPGSAIDLRSLAGCRMRSGLSNFVGRVTGIECENDPGCALPVWMSGHL